MKKRINPEDVISGMLSKKKPVAKMEAYELEDDEMEELEEGIDEEKITATQELIEILKSDDPDAEMFLESLENLVGMLL